MKGDKAVIDYMNELLAGELAARDQYFIHSRMYAEWGYNKLFERLGHEMTEETEHAEQFIRRILMLEGTPNMVPTALNIGTDLPSMLKADLNTELEVRAALKKGIKTVRGKNKTTLPATSWSNSWPTPKEDHAHWARTAAAA